ncbi:MAG: SDR family NAD(P)-dependent oxidoreductase [Rhabdochlamydiaceae bacterium]
MFLTGRNLGKVDSVAEEIKEVGGKAESAQVDALDETAVDKHLQSVIDQTGSVDISFNAIGIPNTRLQGVTLVDLDVDQFSLPISTYTRSYFLTARLAARRMIAQGSGVIMAITSVASRTGVPLVVGVSSAMAAVDALTRALSAELAPKGIRAVGLRPQGIPETGTIREVFGLHAKTWGMSWAQFQGLVASRTHSGRLTTLEEMANMAVFMASDKASAVTRTIVNMSLGSLDD